MAKNVEGLVFLLVNLNNLKIFIEYWRVVGQLFVYYLHSAE